MQRFVRYKTFITPILEVSIIVLGFISGYYFRSITDGIPFIHLQIPYISFEQFYPFIVFWSILWGVLFSLWWMYRLREDIPIFEEIRLVIRYSLLWFFMYISIVYLSTGFIFKKEIPRLIILYVYLFGTSLSIIIRYFWYLLYMSFSRKWIIKKRRIMVLSSQDTNSQILWEQYGVEYVYLDIDTSEEVSSTIRSWEIDAIISLTKNQNDPRITKVIELARIYGIPFSYPKYIPWSSNFLTREWFIGWIPVIEITSLSISFWERIVKRGIDILLSLIWIIILIPLYILIGIWIKIEDPTGPIFFKNRRIWQNGKIFELYKFRYMYWKYSVKDAYWVDNSTDSALKFEESLKKVQDWREWPLYKIQNDPRKMKFWSFIEKLSLDELPQLYNVLKWEMSLIWPRPHQPREVNLYDEEDKQVLIVKPGISGMAQVYGRDENSFKDEVALDRYYIEHYSLLLDLLIFARTFFVVIWRIWKKQKPLAKKK